jgi:lipopolysaccharide export system permease protein
MNKILFRYLAKEILLTAAVFTAILVAIFIVNQVHLLLMRVVDGRLSITIFFQVILLWVPVLLGYLLPGGVYFSILLGYGRLYSDNEMTVMRACGFGEGKLLRYTLVTASGIGMLVALLVLWAVPSTIRYQNHLLSTQGAKLLIEGITPGKFMSMPGEQPTIFYVQDTSRDREQLQKVFIAQLQPAQADQAAQWTVTTAQAASINKNNLHLDVQQGHRYLGTPGSRGFDLWQFARFQLQLPNQDRYDSLHAASIALPTGELWQHKDSNLEYMAELQFRLSMPLSVWILVLLAVPISRVKPRQGKFAKFLPGTLLFIIYANMIFVCRSWIANGHVPAYLGMGAVHLPMLALAWLLWHGKAVYQKYWSHRVAHAKV